MIKIVIIDDEPHNRETLAKLVEKHCPDSRVVGLADGVASGIGIIREKNPDLVLLDINMGDGMGFDLLHALAPISFHVIFISAMDKNMVRAFRLSGLDYLLKPVSPEELTTIINRVMQSELHHFALQLKALEEDLD